MKGRSAAIGRCCQLGMKPSQKRTKRKKKETVEVCGLGSLPDDVALNCLAQLSRLDLAALAVASKAHRALVVCPELFDLRMQMKCLESQLYVLLHILPEPAPRWFVLNPMHRRLKPIHAESFSYQAPESSSSFVVMCFGIYIIGGLINGKPTSDVSFLDCFDHTLKRARPMKKARASATAKLIDNKLYVVGGCVDDDDDADSSNWGEALDLVNQTWDFLPVTVPKMPLNIQQSVVINKNEVYGVDQDGQSFSFSPSKPTFVSTGITDSKPGYRDDWCLIGDVIVCRGTGRKILWCLPDDLDWKEVKGLEELQDILSGWRHQWGLPDTKVEYDITKLCKNSSGNIVIFWNAQPQGPESLELCSAEISLEVRQGREVWGKIEWSGSVFKPDPHSDSYSVKVLYAASVYA